MNRCEYCHKLIKGAVYELNGKTACAECYHDYFVCSICGKKTERIFVTGNNTGYCAECRDRYALSCRSCGMPVTVKDIDKDDIPVCSWCRENGIVNANVLYNVSSYAYRFLEQHFDYDFRSIPLGLSVSESRYDNAERYPMGFAEWVPGKDINGIFVMKYASKNKARYFLVHELTHCWQADRNLINDDNRFVAEGFAVWMESLYAKSINDQKTIQKLLDEKDPVYGDGFRLFYNLEKRTGAGFIMANVRMIHLSSKLNSI